jgi:hypothetical protein
VYEVVPPNVTAMKIAKKTMKTLIRKIPPSSKHNGAFSCQELCAVHVFRSVDSHLQGHEGPKLNLVGLDGVSTRTGGISRRGLR